MKNMPAVCMLLYFLNNLIVGGILSQQPLIVTGNNYPLVSDDDGSVFLNTVALQKALYRQRVFSDKFRRCIIIDCNDTRRIFSGTGCKVDT